MSEGQQPPLSGGEVFFGMLILFVIAVVAFGLFFGMFMPWVQKTTCAHDPDRIKASDGWVCPANLNP